MRLVPVLIPRPLLIPITKPHDYKKYQLMPEKAMKQFTSVENLCLTTCAPVHFLCHRFCLSPDHLRLVLPISKIHNKFLSYTVWWRLDILLYKICHGKRKRVDGRKPIITELNLLLLEFSQWKKVKQLIWMLGSCSLLHNMLVAFLSRLLKGWVPNAKLKKI